MSRRRKTQDCVDDHLTAERVSDAFPFLLAPTDDGVPRPDTGLHLDRDDLPECLEPDICRRPSRARHSSLDLGSPARVATAEDPLDQPSVGHVVEQRRRTRVDVDPQVGPQGNGRSPPDLEPDRRVAGLQLADHRPADADHARDISLMHAQADPKLSQLLTESSGVHAGEARGFAQDDPARGGELIRGGHSVLLGGPRHAGWPLVGALPARRPRVSVGEQKALIQPLQSHPPAGLARSVAWRERRGH